MVKDNIQRKTLSIRISTNGFCFCNYAPADISSLKYFHFPVDESTSLASNLGRAIEECPFINKESEYDVKAIIETAEFTSLPSEYDNKQDYKTYYRFCFPKNGNSVEIYSNKLTAQGESIIFPVDKEVSNILQQLGTVNFYTPASIIMGYITSKGFEEERYMLAYLQETFSLLIVVQEGRIVFANIFDAEHKENTLFYMLSIWKQHGFSQTEDILYLCGGKEVEEASLLINKFIRHRKRLNPNEEFTPSLLNRIDGIPFDLQALILCG